MSAHGWSLPMPAAEVEVECQGSAHVLRWEEGHLVATGHEDPEGERLLAALGGEVAGCLQVVAAWQAHAGDARVLALGPVSAHDVIAADEGAVANVDDVMGVLAAQTQRRAARRLRAGASGASLVTPGMSTNPSAAPVASGPVQFTSFAPPPQRGVPRLTPPPPPSGGTPQPGSPVPPAGSPPPVPPARPVPPAPQVMLPQGTRPLPGGLGVAGTQRFRLPPRWPAGVSAALGAGAAALSAAAMRAASQALMANAWTAGSDWRATSELLHLLVMDRSLVDRLQLVIWATREHDLERALADVELGREEEEPEEGAVPVLPVRDGPALIAAAVARVRASAHEWYAGAPELTQPEVHVELVAGAASLEVEPEAEPGRARMVVGTGWLPRVWGRQLAVVDGYLVMEALEVDAAAGRAVVRALRPPLSDRPFPPRTVELARRAGADAWTLANR
jgi:hypothetical protein